jgi:hypothetical protein
MVRRCRLGAFAINARFAKSHVLRYGRPDRTRHWRMVLCQDYCERAEVAGKTQAKNRHGTHEQSLGSGDRGFALRARIVVLPTLDVVRRQ